MHILSNNLQISYKAFYKAFIVFLHILLYRILSPFPLSYAEQPGIYWIIKLGERVFIPKLRIKLNPSCEFTFIPHGSVLS